MTVYTGRGDEGQTDLFDGSRVAKTNLRVQAYGTVDELNALVGMVRPTGYADIDERLERVQNQLHILQAVLANPETGGEPAIDDSHVQTLESWIDDIEAELEPQQEFILPGGGAAGSRLHHARTVCRRAERQVMALTEAEDVEQAPLVYLNRLSDLLFVTARLANKRDGVDEVHPTY
ncbi:cob(I)yrinic acid a,c-diamide adenosyltransferase [Halodesulfurarchaeum formicicum]|uniref:ATP:cob(I)alamin adenosyltransferase n=1 Tax=Halodesulfurarchaeum formicicum TaxID=1873524 RepID=A0A1J1AAP1_9EURY|nr:cob(I)yrinic acid a,c-diamide adenosyltransferase [Halodesulfurarchaeum formicicum]APE94957.1 ATP:cob(I)alamin adenosyltransferase [Halodesulfurarchaeum formicicum]